MTTGLTDFFRQNLWANLRMLDACASLSDAQLEFTMPGTYGSIRATLMHIVAGEEGYVQHLTGQRPEPALHSGDPFPGFDALQQRSRQNGEALLSIAEQFEPGRVLQLSFQGQVYAVPAIFVLIQAINHATDHRSQMATLMSQQGITPPELDGWAYYDAMSASDAGES